MTLFRALVALLPKQSVWKSVVLSIFASAVLAEPMFAQSNDLKDWWTNSDYYRDFPMHGVLELAEHGSTKAQTSVGTRYYVGRGVRKDNTEAARWYKKAADQGFAPAQFLLGGMFQDGDGIPQSDSEAAHWARQSAEQEYAPGQALLASMYINGVGVEQNDSEAARLLKLSADQGYSAGQAVLGMLYEAGRGVPKNYALAVYWYRLAAEQGEEESQKRLPIAEKKLAEATAEGDNMSAETVETLNDFASYSHRTKTLLEEVLNYSTTGNENGNEDFYWIQSTSIACTVDRRGGPSQLAEFASMTSMFQLNVPSSINVSSFNETAFSVDVSPILDAGSGKFMYGYKYGDPNYSVSMLFMDPILDGNAAPDPTRLSKAWNLAFEECPGKRSKF